MLDLPPLPLPPPILHLDSTFEEHAAIRVSAEDVHSYCLWLHNYGPPPWSPLCIGWAMRHSCGDQSYNDWCELMGEYDEHEDERTYPLTWASYDRPPNEWADLPLVDEMYKAWQDDWKPSPVLRATFERLAALERAVEAERRAVKAAEEAARQVELRALHVARKNAKVEEAAIVHRYEDATRGLAENDDEAWRAAEEKSDAEDQAWVEKYGIPLWPEYYTDEGIAAREKWEAVRRERAKEDWLVLASKPRTQQEVDAWTDKYFLIQIEGVPPVTILPFRQQQPLPPPQPSPVMISATPFKWKEPATIPERQWLYGHSLIRGHVTVTVAPAGTGKSSKEIVDALAMASGRMLLHDKPYRPIRVWLWNGEDPMDELERRIAAAAVHHKLRPEDLAGRLFVDSGRKMEIKVARMEGSGTTIAVPVYEAVVNTIRQNKIDVVSIDPFVSSHSVSENDNNAIDVVSKLWAKIADVTGCATHLIHHPRKTGGVAVEADDARGAGALIATARVVRTLNVMSKEEAAKAGVDNHTRYVRVDDAKANLAPRSAVARWLKIEDVPLGNGGITGGDRVGVVTRWQWPDAMEGVTQADLAKAQAAVAEGGPWRKDVQAKEWVGKPIAEALGLDVGKKADKAKVTGMIRQWLEDGALVEVKRQDDNRKDRSYVEVGKVAHFPGAMKPPV
jgi:RecA-family ATPase